MTHDELINSINALATGENAEAVATITKEVDGLYTTIDTATRLHDEDAKKIETLNDTNMKLFLRVTGSPAEQKEEEKPEETLDDFIAKIANPDTNEKEK